MAHEIYSNELGGLPNDFAVLGRGGGGGVP